MRKIGCLIILVSLSIIVKAQELNCNVQVVSKQIQGTNKQVFTTLQTAVLEFMNNKTWTNHVYTTDERIECNILINVTEQISTDEFDADIQIQSRRPVYNSSYNTVLLNYKDNNFKFTYVEYQPLEFSLNSHSSNLTSVLAFYAYIILGLDYDSFSPNGGNPHFQNAEKIVSNAQNAPERGWKPYESTTRKNRYWLINNILGSDYKPARTFFYKYHRLGLDQMDAKVDEGRSQILESLKELQKIYREKPDPFMHFLQIIFDAKYEEFINVFAEGLQTEKDQSYKILLEIDPANSKNYERIKSAGP